MSPTVTVNGLTMCHKDSKGIATSTLPDICLTPIVVPVPIPYVNTAISEDLVDGSVSVNADGGSSIAIQGCRFIKSTGDEAGVIGGVTSGVNLSEASFISFSSDVTIDGKPVCRLTDQLTMNLENTSCNGIVIPPVTAVGESAEVELEKNQLEIYLVDSENNPIPNVDYKVVRKDGSTVTEGTLDDNGYTLIENMDIDNYSVIYPGLDQIHIA